MRNLIGIFRKSSYSGPEADCVELAWMKSSHSGQDTNCVEVHHDLGAIRDSKNVAGPTLAVDIPALVTAIRAGKLNR